MMWPRAEVSVVRGRPLVGRALLLVALASEWLLAVLAYVALSRFHELYEPSEYGRMLMLPRSDTADVQLVAFLIPMLAFAALGAGCLQWTRSHLMSMEKVAAIVGLSGPPVLAAVGRIYVEFGQLPWLAS